MFVFFSQNHLFTPPDGVLDPSIANRCQTIVRWSTDHLSREYVVVCHHQLDVGTPAHMDPSGVTISSGKLVAGSYQKGVW
jgi:hypothetical protein